MKTLLLATAIILGMSSVANAQIFSVPAGNSDVLIHYPPSPHELYSPTAGSHWVRGHYRRNGTYVAPYRRSNPNGVCWDNINGCR